MFSYFWNQNSLWKEMEMCCSGLVIHYPINTKTSPCQENVLAWEMCRKPTVLLIYNLLSTRVNFKAHWFGIKRDCVLLLLGLKFVTNFFLKVRVIISRNWRNVLKCLSSWSCFQPWYFLVFSSKHNTNINTQIENLQSFS